ncbi:DMT family transporter [Sphingosinicella soli]|uniref:Small multidrug resistance pump n=1 Tax=Sphingosinicella soli TaxID=333708 RepID=A0A7W7B207_9SPHN|nr:SMR family transporter [Sphingosinicella soli]MBB4632560.1 small multidrug resistance pump [Sphingosinicella soli]
MQGYPLLALAIVCEVIATSCLKLSDGFTRLVPSAITVVFYGISFFVLSLTLKFIPVGVAYAIWSALGIVLISMVGYVAFDQKLDIAAMVGMALIIVGVLVVSVISKAGN